MGKSWTVRELEDEEIESYSKDELPGLPYGFEQDDIRNFALENGGYGFVGGADLFEAEDHYVLMNCNIDESMREKRYNGQSPFADLIEARLDEAEGPVRTDAVTDHGKTQYKMNQYGFEPTVLDPHPSPHSTPFIGMWKGNFGKMIANLPEKDRQTIENNPLEVRPLEADGERSGFDFEVVRPFSELDEGLHVYQIQRGDKNPEGVIDEIIDIDENSDNYAADIAVNPRFPQTEDLAEGLQDCGFDFFGFKPPVAEDPGTVHFGRFNRKMYGVSVTDETQELLDELGIEYRMNEEGEKSSEVTLLP